MPPRVPKVGVAVLVVLMIFFTIVIAVLAGLGRLQIIEFNPDTRSVCNAPFSGWGGFPDPSSDIVKKKELFSRDRTYLSWVVDGTAIPFTVQGRIRWDCGLIGLHADHMRYRFEINTGAGFVPAQQDDFPEGVIQFDGGQFSQGILDGQITDEAPPREITIDGTTYRDVEGMDHIIPDGAVLRVYLDAGWPPVGFGNQGKINWVNYAQDEIQLQSGVPEVRWEQDLYEVGDAARVRWTVPFTKVDGGAYAYYLTVLNLNTNEPVFTGPITNATGIKSIAVTADMFSSSGPNRLRAEIYSPVFRAAIQDTAVIDDADLAPSVDSVTLNLPEFREGDRVDISIAASPNAKTSSPIVRYYVLAHIGGSKLFDAFTSSSKVSLIASRTGILDVEVTAHDEAGRSSAVKRVQATVGNVIVECEAFPDLPKCGHQESSSLLLAIVALVILFVVATVFGVLMPKPYGLLLFIVVLAVGAVALFATGTLDAIVAAAG